MIQYKIVRHTNDVEFPQGVTQEQKRSQETRESNVSLGYTERPKQLRITIHLASMDTSLEPGAQPGDSEVGHLPQNPALPLYSLVSQCPQTTPKMA